MGDLEGFTDGLIDSEELYIEKFRQLIISVVLFFPARNNKVLPR